MRCDFPTPARQGWGAVKVHIWEKMPCEEVVLARGRENTQPSLIATDGSVQAAAHSRLTGLTGRSIDDALAVIEGRSDYQFPESFERRRDRGGALSRNFARGHELIATRFAVARIGYSAGPAGLGGGFAPPVPTWRHGVPRSRRHARSHSEGSSCGSAPLARGWSRCLDVLRPRAVPLCSNCYRDWHHAVPRERPGSAVALRRQSQGSASSRFGHGHQA